MSICWESLRDALASKAMQQAKQGRNNLAYLHYSFLVG